MPTKINQKNGFTLIELLVVVTIIGLLASIILASLSAAKMRARDARRISDLRQIRNALELYRNDKGLYPDSSCGQDCNGYRYSDSASSWQLLQNDLSPYISKLPVDPINSSCPPWTDDCYSYAYGNVYSSSGRYDLVAQFEDKNNSLRCELKNYKYASNGTSLWCGIYSKYLYDDGPR